jgi:hypothetical protein
MRFNGFRALVPNRVAGGGKGGSLVPVWDRGARLPSLLLVPDTSIAFATVTWMASEWKEVTVIVGGGRCFICARTLSEQGV